MFLCSHLFCSFIFDRIIFFFHILNYRKLRASEDVLTPHFWSFFSFFYLELNYRLHGSKEFILVYFSLDREEAYHNVISFLSSSLTCLFFFSEKSVSADNGTIWRIKSQLKSYELPFVCLFSML